MNADVNANDNAANDADSAGIGPSGTLLGPGDPPPFEIVNRGRASDVVFVCDHASRTIPAALGTLGLTGAAREDHIAWDIGAADMARDLAEAFGAPLVLAGYSRLVIDCNRNPTHETSVLPVSDGIAVPGNEKLSDEDRQRRVSEIFQPYHDAIDGVMVDACEERVPALVSVHSYTPDYQDEDRPWHIGVLWDSDPRLSLPLIDALGRDPELCIGDNQPYSGKDEVGYTIRRHAERRGLPHVLIEVRQDLVATRDGARHWAKVLEDALRLVFTRDPELFRVEYY